MIWGWAADSICLSFETLAFGARKNIFTVNQALKREEIPSLTLAFLGPRFRRLTFHQPTLSQASQAIHTQQQRALI
jgi:hypothetical protein